MTEYTREYEDFLRKAPQCDCGEWMQTRADPQDKWFYYCSECGVGRYSADLPIFQVDLQ
jgi:hypothetical protein